MRMTMNMEEFIERPFPEDCEVIDNTHVLLDKTFIGQDSIIGNTLDST